MVQNITHDHAPAGLEQPIPNTPVGAEQKPGRQLGRIIVFSNLKGGTGKSTTALSVIVGLLRQGKTVASLDLDMDQEALSRYLHNRTRFANLTKLRIGMPSHHRFSRIDPGKNGAELSTRINLLSSLVDKLVAENDYVIIDCPSLDNPLTRTVTARADILTSPVNESFLDIDVIGEVRGTPPTVTRVGPFAEMIGAEMQRRREEDIKSLDWIVVRNRRNPSATRHTAAIGTVLDELSRNLSFRVTDGFVDRLIFRELFLVGLSILDLRKDDPLIANNSSHKSAYDEASILLQSIGKSLFSEDEGAERLTGEESPALVDAKLVRRGRNKPADGLEAPPHLDADRAPALASTTPAAGSLATEAPAREGQSRKNTNGEAGSAENLGSQGEASTENTGLAEDTDQNSFHSGKSIAEADRESETPAMLASFPDVQRTEAGAPPLLGPRGNILVVYDATGGRRHRIKFRATLSRLAGLGCVVSVHECQGPIDGKAFFREINISQYGAILVAGSDNCLMALAGPLAASGLPVSVASPQSGRHLANELGLSLAPKTIAERAIDGEAREWYLAEANNHPFVSFATVGLAADLSFGPRQRRAALAIAGGGSPGDDGYRIVVDGRYRDVAGAFIVNAQFLPRDFASIEGAVRGEPRLYAVMLERGAWRDRLRFRSALMAGRLPRAKGVVVEAAEQVSIWGAAGEAIFVEGEAICPLPAQIRIMRKPIKILS